MDADGHRGGLSGKKDYMSMVSYARIEFEMSKRKIGKCNKNVGPTYLIIKFYNNDNINNKKKR